MKYKKLYTTTDFAAILIGLAIGGVLFASFFGGTTLEAISYILLLYVALSLMYIHSNTKQMRLFHHDISEVHEDIMSKSNSNAEEKRIEKAKIAKRIEVLEKTIKEAEIDYRGMEGYCQKLINEDEKFQKIKGQDPAVDHVHEHSMKLAKNLMLECKCTADYLEAIHNDDMEKAKLIDRATSK